MRTGDEHIMKEGLLVNRDYYMPGEWEYHQMTLMAWPVRDSLIWKDNYEEVCMGYAQVSNEISRFEPVTMIVNEGDESYIRDFLRPEIDIFKIPHDDSWMRDNGPTFLVSRINDDVVGVNWKFNGWGEKYKHYDLDDKVAVEVLRRLGVNKVDAPIVLEGGSIHVDGEGTLITTEECLLNPNRNPDLTKGQIEDLLKQTLNVSKVIWLRKGVFGDETDGHVDNIACFSRPGVVLVQTCHDKNDPNYEITKENMEVLKDALDAKGRRLKVLEVPQPPARRYKGELLTLSYVNFYIVNNGIIMPVFGGDATETDRQAEKVLRSAFPDRSLVKVDGMKIVKEGGNVHCVTQQVPLAQSKKHVKGEIL